MPLRSCNTENMRKFVEALRSGEFTQGIGWLERTDKPTGVTKNCCLGVACRVAYRNGVELNPLTNFRELVEFDGTSDYMPALVSEWLGLEAKTENDNSTPSGAWMGNPKLLTEDGTECLATELNDSHMYSFSQIADAFERTYLKD